MLIGINFSRWAQLEFILQLFESRKVDFIELLIDDLLPYDPTSIKKVFNEIPLSFHIMRSGFINSNKKTLSSIAERILYFREILNPIYISDHLGEFFLSKPSYGVFLECDYTKPYLKEKILSWKEMLDCELLLENYATFSSKEVNQPNFMDQLIKEEICEVLFDFSNAIVAHNNANIPLTDWNFIIKNSSHFHISSYRKFPKLKDRLIDSHDGLISQKSLNFLKEHINSIKNNSTIVMEFDAEGHQEDIISNICSIRELMKNHA